MLSAAQGRPPQASEQATDSMWRTAVREKRPTSASPHDFHPGMASRTRVHNASPTPSPLFMCGDRINDDAPCQTRPRPSAASGRSVLRRRRQPSRRRTERWRRMWRRPTRCRAGARRSPRPRARRPGASGPVSRCGCAWVRQCGRARRGRLSLSVCSGGMGERVRQRRDPSDLQVHYREGSARRRTMYSSRLGATRSVLRESLPSSKLYPAFYSGTHVPHACIVRDHLHGGQERDGSGSGRGVSSLSFLHRLQQARAGRTGRQSLTLSASCCFRTLSRALAPPRVTPCQIARPSRTQMPRKIQSPSVAILAVVGRSRRRRLLALFALNRRPSALMKLRLRAGGSVA